MIVKRKKCILPRAVKFLQRTGALQIINQRIDEPVPSLCSISPNPIVIIEETALHGNAEEADSMYPAGNRKPR